MRTGTETYTSVKVRIVQYDSLDSWPPQEGGAEPSDGSRNKKLSQSLSWAGLRQQPATEPTPLPHCGVMQSMAIIIHYRQQLLQSPLLHRLQRVQHQADHLISFPCLTASLPRIALPAHHAIKKGCRPSKIVCSSFRQEGREEKERSPASSKSPGGSTEASLN